MADLKTNYVDDVLDTTKNKLRKYQQIQNDDGTVSFVDVTEYTQVGTSFGAKDINDTNAAINDVNGKLTSFPDYLNYIDITNNLSNYIVPDNGYIMFCRTSINKGSVLEGRINSVRVIRIDANTSNLSMATMIFHCKKGDVFVASGFNTQYSEIKFMYERR